MHLLGSGVQGSVGRMGRFQHFNRAMTSAERTALFQAGVAEADRGASNTIINTMNFSAGVDGWAANSGVALTGNQDAIGGEDDWLKIERTGAIDGVRVTKAMLTAGKNYSISGMKINNPGGVTRWFGVFIGDTPTLGGSTPATAFVEIPAGSTAVLSFPSGRIAATTTMTVGPTLNTGIFWSAVPTGTVFYVKGMVTKQIGNTVNLSPTGIQLAPGQWLDSSGNKSHVHLPDGTRLLNPATQGQVRGTNTWSASDTLQYVNGVNSNILPNNVILTLYAKATVSGTFDLGDGSDQDRYGAGVTIGTTWAPVTTLLPTHDGTNRKLTVKPTASYSGTVETTWRVEQVAT
jgi:hypothetical protein